jgi:MFS family permease
VIGAQTFLRPVAASFVVFGVFAGGWAVGAIDVEHAFDLTDAQLGLLLAAGIGGATAIAIFGGAITDRWGTRLTLTAALASWAGLLAFAAGAPTIALFAPLFVVAVAAGGMVDVVMNIAAADALSSEPGRLVRFHGLFNGGAVIGALATGIALHADMSWRVVWVAIAVVAVATAAWVRRTELPALPSAEHPSILRAVASLRHEGLVVVAAVFGAAAMVEGAIATWGVLYLRDQLGVGVLAGVTAYAIGESLATLTRVAGGQVVGALGARRAILIGGSLAAAGIATEALCGVVPLAAAGLAAAAVGISVVWPLLLADVNNHARHPPLAIGGVTACGYLGMVTGPVLVGFLSSAFGLQTALLVLAAIAAFVAVTPAQIRVPAARSPVEQRRH